MRTLVVGARIPAERAVEALGGPERQARAWTVEPVAGAQPDSSSALARALLAFEREIEADPEAQVVLADDSDAALAAALVASKRLLAVEVAAGVASGGGVNARLISQLTGA